MSSLSQTTIKNLLESLEGQLSGRAYLKNFASEDEASWIRRSLIHIENNILLACEEHGLKGDELIPKHLVEKAKPIFDMAVLQAAQKLHYAFIQIGFPLNESPYFHVLLSWNLLYRTGTRKFDIELITSLYCFLKLGQYKSFIKGTLKRLLQDEKNIKDFFKLENATRIAEKDTRTWSMFITLSNIAHFCCKSSDPLRSWIPHPDIYGHAGIKYTNEMRSDLERYVLTQLNSQLSSLKDLVIQRSYADGFCAQLRSAVDIAVLLNHGPEQILLALIEVDGPDHFVEFRYESEDLSATTYCLNTNTKLRNHIQTGFSKAYETPFFYILKENRTRETAIIDDQIADVATKIKQLREEKIRQLELTESRIEPTTPPPRRGSDSSADSLDSTASSVSIDYPTSPSSPDSLPLFDCLSPLSPMNLPSLEEWMAPDTP